MHSSCYETLTFHFRRLRLWQGSRTQDTLPRPSRQLPVFLLAWLVIYSALGPISFLFAPRTLKANNSARTYRSRPLHPRHIVPSLAIIVSLRGKGGDCGYSRDKCYE